MTSTTPNGTIVTQIRRPSSAIDNTRPGWPNSSLVPVFNRNGGPSATEALHGLSDRRPAKTPPTAAKPCETAELIGQATLCLGDGLQRGTTEPSREHAAELPAIKTLGRRAPDEIEQELHGSTDQAEVPVEVCKTPKRGGRPRPSKEHYPFGTIALSKEVDGQMEGESFLIPHEDHPLRRLAAGRKRHKSKRFITRKLETGVRVWRDR